MKNNTVLTNGCFDILHVGHIQLFKYCKSLAEELIVLLNSDESVKSLGKGVNRPINTQSERYELLTSIKYIDKVIIFEETTPCELVAKIKPNFYVKGGDYTIDNLPESKVVKKYGGQIRIFNHTGHSTTNLIRKINDN